MRWPWRPGSHRPFSPGAWVPLPVRLWRTPPGTCPIGDSLGAAFRARRCECAPSELQWSGAARPPGLRAGRSSPSTRRHCWSLLRAMWPIAYRLLPHRRDAVSSHPCSRASAAALSSIVSNAELRAHRWRLPVLVQRFYRRLDPAGYLFHVANATLRTSTSTRAQRGSGSLTSFERLHQLGLNTADPEVRGGSAQAHSSRIPRPA